MLELARSTYPAETATTQFIRLLTRVLLRLGDVNKIRWAFQTVLGEGNAAAVTSMAATVTGPKNGGDAAAGAGAAAGLSLRDQLELWEDYLNAETILGLSGIDRLDILRNCRDAARQAYEDSERAKHVITGSAAVAAAESASSARTEGIFEYSNQLIERYSGIASTIPEVDSALSERSRSFGGRATAAAAPAEGSTAARSRRWGSTANESQDTSSTADTLGVPQVLRSFINKLPPYMAPSMPDFDAFARSLRGLILPPRPMVEEDVAVGSKRAAPGSEWLAGLGNEDDDAAGDDLTSATRDDIFRQRQRARLL